jgi:hypothetical protein
MSAEEWWRAAALVVSLFGAIVSVWGASIRHRLAGPKLRVTLRSEDGSKTFWKGPDGNPHPMYFYHLRVTNTRHYSAPAQNVQVFVTNLEKATAGQRDPVPGWLSGPIQLAWQFTEKPEYRTIGAERFCDLGYLNEPGFMLKMYSEPNDFENRLKKNERMRVEIRALADNAESKPLRLEISWNGEWTEDSEEFNKEKHLIVKTRKSSIKKST